MQRPGHSQDKADERAVGALESVCAHLQPAVLVRLTGKGRVRHQRLRQLVRGGRRGGRGQHARQPVARAGQQAEELRQREREVDQLRQEQAE